MSCRCWPKWVDERRVLHRCSCEVLGSGGSSADPTLRAARTPGSASATGVTVLPGAYAVHVESRSDSSAQHDPPRARDRSSCRSAAAGRPLAAFRGLAKEGNRRAAAQSRAFSSSKGFFAPDRASHRAVRVVVPHDSRNSAWSRVQASRTPQPGMNTSPRTSTSSQGGPCPRARCGMLGHVAARSP